MKIAFIMLAAGNSCRFGANKLLYEWKGKPMYQYTLEYLSGFQGVSLTVVTQYQQIEEEAQKRGAKVVRNPHPEEGISSSLKLGLRANIHADACLFSVSDQPWLTHGTIERLLETFQTSKKGIACVSHQGKTGNPCIFSKKYYDELLALTGDVGGKSVIKKHSDDTVIYSVANGKELEDIDYPSMLV